MTCPVSSPTKWLNLDLNQDVGSAVPASPLHGPLSEQPLGSVLRALYQQHPFGLSLLPPFPLLCPELNPQQISELNLERA